MRRTSTVGTMLAVSLLREGKDLDVEAPNLSAEAKAAARAIVAQDGRVAPPARAAKEPIDVDNDDDPDDGDGGDDDPDEAARKKPQLNADGTHKRECVCASCMTAWRARQKAKEAEKRATTRTTYGIPLGSSVATIEVPSETELNALFGRNRR